MIGQQMKSYFKRTGRPPVGNKQLSLRLAPELIAKLADCPKLVRDLGVVAHNVARLRTLDRTAEKYVSAIMAVVAGKADSPNQWTKPEREH